MEPVQIHVRLNGSLVNHIGQARVSVTLPAAATVAGLLRRLATEHPAAEGALRACVAVVAGAHVGRDHSLMDQQEVALLMPISGG